MVIMGCSLIPRLCGRPGYKTIWGVAHYI